MASQHPQTSRQKSEHQPTRSADSQPENGDDTPPAQPWHGPSAKPAVRLRPAKEQPVFRDWASI